MIKVQDIQQNFPWPPTEQQLGAMQTMAYFMANFEEYDGFILRGYAGTGKTTLLSSFVAALHRYRMASVLLAPTGRAAKVMRQYSNRPTSTIHRKIYRKKKASSPDSHFDLAPNKHINTVFIIDESSMISDGSAGFFTKSLLSDVFDYVKQGENCKLLFVGDVAQLPPIGSTSSPALDQKHLALKYGGKFLQIELTEVVRQAQDSGILYNATLVRQKIHESSDSNGTNDPMDLPQLRLSPFRDIFKLSGERFIEGLNYAYNKYGMEYSIVICRSNKNANLYNKHIRHQLLFRDEELSGGDQVMVVKNNYYWLGQNDENTTSFIANGDMAEIRRVRNVHEQYGFRFADVSLHFPDMEDLEPIHCRVLLDTLYVDTPSLPQDQQKILYDHVMQDYREEGLSSKEIHEKILQDPYYNALQIKFSMAITCHKAQGGQWDVVFIDQGYLSENQADKEFLQWLYTAMTRAKQELFLVNFHPNFFPKSAGN